MVYRPQADDSEPWRLEVIDESLAVSGLAVADLTGNGYPEIVAVGAATGNVVIYRNSGR